MTETELNAAVQNILRTNQRETDGHCYTIPSPSAYPYQWLWDSCFHAVMYSYFDAAYGKNELRSLLAKQWQNGLVPHMLYWEQNPDIMHVDWGVADTSTLTQPPLIAYAAWRLHQAAPDKAFLAELYPKLAAFHQYLWRERRLPRRDLLGIINPDESGEDNSPRFDSEMNLPPQHAVADNRTQRFALFDIHKSNHYQANQGTHQHFWVEDVPFNVFAVLALESMVDIAEAINEDPAPWQTQIIALKTALRQELFADGSFWSAHGLAGELVRVDTWARFAPLLIGLYSDEEAASLITDQLKNPKTYARLHRVPTVAADDPSYNPAEPAWGRPWQHPDWRGAIWMLPNWCIYHGLQRYGYTDEAAGLRRNCVELVSTSGFRENYHPDTGTGMGAEGFTWSGLIIDMRSQLTF